MAARDTAGTGNLFATVPENARMLIFPIDGKSFVYLKVLASLNAASAKNALIGVIAIKRI